MKILTLIVLCTILATFAIPVTASPAWTIDGNKVYIDDSNVYLSATPHTLYESGWVEFELLSKVYEGEIDAVWGFNLSEGVRPRTPQIWAQNAPHTKLENVVNEYANKEITIGNIISYEVLQWNGIEPDIGNYNNSKLVKLTYNTENITETIVAYNTYTQHTSTSATFRYYDTVNEEQEVVEYYPDWKPLPTTLFTTTHYYLGVDKWFFVKLDAPIQKNVTYKARCWVNIPFPSLDRVKGKYIWGVKPSGETLIEAKQSGHLYLLDPWYDSNWSYRKSFSINGTTAGAQTDYQLELIVHKGSGSDSGNEVYLDNHCEDDFADIRFTSDNAVGLLDYWIEEVNSGDNATMWVEFNSIAASPDATTFYIYYGNASVNTTSDGDATFRFFDDFPGTSLNLDKWEVVSGSTPTVSSGIMTMDDPTQTMRTDDNWARPAASDSKIQLHNHRHFGVREVGVSCFYEDIGYRGDGAGTTTFYCSYNNDDWTEGAGTEDSWIIMGWTWTTDNVYGYENGVQLAHKQAGDGDGIPDWSAEYYMYVYSGDSSPTIECDWTFIRNFADPEPIWGAWESEEQPPAPTVITDNATGITQTTATLSGNITAINNSSITTRGFVWDTDNHSAPTGNITAPADSDYANYWTESDGFSTGVYTHEITGLSANTTYYYRACARNDFGGWGYGNEIQFTTEVPRAVGAPTDFTIIDLTGNTVNVTWTMGSDSTETLIRMKRNSYPTDNTDGELIFEDTGTSTNYTGLSLETTTYYFRAWGSDGSSYSDNYTGASIGGSGMILLALVLLPLGLSISSFAIKSPPLSMLSTIFWFILGAYSYTLSESTWDLYYAIFFACMFIGLIMGLAGVTLWQRSRSKTIEQESEVDEDEEYEKEYRGMVNKLRKTRSNLRGGVKRKRRNHNLY